MSQNTLANITSGTLAGSTMVGVFNAALESLSKWWSGSTTPTTGNTGLTSIAGFVWHDTVTNTLKVYDQAATTWIVVGYFDETAKTFTPHINGSQFYATDTGSANAYAVAPTPARTAYDTGLPVFWVAANNSTGASTLNVSSLGTKALVRFDGTAIKANDIVSGATYGTIYDGTSMRLLTAPPAASVIKGTASNLKLSAPGGAKIVTVTADALALVDTSRNGVIETSVSLSLNLAASGANGLDTGSLASSTWYAVWVINNGGTAAALASLSATAPTLPGGVTQKARVGWVRTDGSSNAVAFVQFGRGFQYINTGAGLPQMATGTVGSTSGTYASVAVGAFVPSTAASIRLAVHGDTSVVGVAPNANYGAYNSASIPPPIIVNGNTPNAQIGDMTLESTNIYWFSSGSLSVLYCLGFEDNL